MYILLTKYAMPKKLISKIIVYYSYNIALSYYVRLKHPH